MSKTAADDNAGYEDAGMGLMQPVVDVFVEVEVVVTVEVNVNGDDI